MELDVEIECRAEALNQGDGAGFPVLACQARFLDQYSEESSKQGNRASLEMVAEANLGPFVTVSAENGLAGSTDEGVSYIYPDETFHAYAGLSSEGGGRPNVELKVGADAGLDIEPGVNVSIPDTAEAISEAARTASRSVQNAAERFRNWLDPDHRI